MLNVTTFLNEIAPARCLSTKVLYMRIGLLPVGRPRTNGLSSVGANVLMRSATSVSVNLKHCSHFTYDVLGNVFGSSQLLITND
jgi:hypothetical protein